MPREIERKFLVTSDAWRALARPTGGTRLRQGYIAAAPGRTVRVRLAGNQGYLTVKGPADSTGVARDEFEYPIPAHDAMAMLDTLCEQPQIDKTRFTVPAGSPATAGPSATGTAPAPRPLAWEVDVFHADNDGLVLAEIELSSPDQPFERPSWLGAEVTADPRYRNSSLAQRPYRTWGGAPPACSA